MKTLKFILPIVIALTLFSCEKEIITESFTVDLSIQNNIQATPDGYVCEGIEDFCTSFPINIYAGAFVGTQREANDANNNVFRTGVDGTYIKEEIEQNQTLSFSKEEQLEPGALVMITVQCRETEMSFWVNNGDKVHVTLNEKFEVCIKAKGNTAKSPFPKPTTIGGKWVNEASCTNVNGEHAYFKFNKDGSGVFYKPDCSNACIDGKYTGFNFLTNSGSVDLEYVEVSDYCDQNFNLPESETISYLVSTNILIMEGEYWTKQ